MKPQFTLHTITALVAAFAVVAFVAKRCYDSLPGPLIPIGTANELVIAIRDVFENPSTTWESSRPGWSTVAPTPAMKRVVAFGDEAIPVLLANLHNRNQVMRFQTYEMLGMLDAKSTVPALIDSLYYDDGTDDAFIVAKLAEITDHPDGYRFYRKWFDANTQKEATETYRRWCADHQKALKEKPEQ